MHLVEVRGLHSSVETFFANGVLILSFFRSNRQSVRQKNASPPSKGPGGVVKDVKRLFTSS